MTELIVLSEYNCEKDLQKLGITPKAIYTDPDMCEQALLYERRVQLLILFKGLSRFKMTKVVEIYRKFLDVSDIDKDMTNVIHSRILSDIQIQGVSHYFLYKDNLRDIKRVKVNTNIANIGLLGTGIKEVEVDFWGSFKIENSETCKVVLDNDRQIELANTDLEDREEHPELIQMKAAKKILL